MMSKKLIKFAVLVILVTIADEVKEFSYTKPKYEIILNSYSFQNPVNITVFRDDYIGESSGTAFEYSAKVNYWSNSFLTL